MEGGRVKLGPVVTREVDDDREVESVPSKDVVEESGAGAKVKLGKLEM